MVKRFLRDNPIHKKIVPFLDYIFLLRPTLFFGVWVMVVLGMASSRFATEEFPLWFSQINFKTLFLFMGITCISSSTFILNQILDVDGDRENNKLFLLEKYISIEKANKIHFLLFGLGIIFTGLGNITLIPIVVLIYILWGIAYNKEPLKWKKHPFFGLITNTLVGILLFSIGWIHVNEFNSLLSESFFPYLFSYSFCFTAVSLLTMIPDMDGDKRVSANTFPLYFGRRVSVLLASCLVLCAFYISLFKNDPVASTATIASIPFFLYALIRNLDKDIIRAIRYPIFLLNFFVFAIYPWLAVFVVLVYYFAKYYYWHRFDLHYPTFLVEND